MEKDWLPDRSKFKDASGRYLTQSLFLEGNYDDLRYVIYTLKDDDHTHNGITYPSLRKLYLEANDPTEYVFSTTYLWGWEHWQKIINNAILLEHVQRWREELEVRIRANAVKAMLEMTKGNFNAAKWAVDGHWNVRRGKVTPAEKEREKQLRGKVLQETKTDAERVVSFIRKDQSNG